MKHLTAYDPLMGEKIDEHGELIESLLSKTTTDGYTKAKD